MTKILFVCHGNICRSPLAEFYMKHIVDKAGRSSEFEILSKATSTEEIWNGKGSPIYGPMREVMEEHGVPYDDSKRAMQVKSRDYDYFDLIVCMDKNNLRNIAGIIGNDPDGKVHLLMEYADGVEKSFARDVADPWYTRDFEAAYRDIKAGCEGLLERL